MMRNWRQSGDAHSTRDIDHDQRAPLPGVIDTIGFGYAALMLRPLVILPIVLLDLSLAFGPRVVTAPLTNRLSESARERGGNWNDIATEIERLEGLNVLEALTLGVPLLRTPGIASSFSSGELDALAGAGAWPSMPVWSVVALFFVALAAGVALAAVYRLMLASAVAPERDTLDALRPRTVARVTLRFCGWALTLTGLALLVAMPVLTATVIGVIFGFGQVTILWLLLLFPVTWAWVHFFFSVHALVIDDCGPLAALRSSYQVVQRYFWQSIRFMIVSLLITSGFSFALRELAGSLPGALLAILLNAMIASGMLLAAMLFYRDRAGRLGLTDRYPER